MRRIDTIAIHQTGTPTGTVASIRRYHQQNRGYSDIGYHYLITPDAVVHCGRPIERIGSHVRGANATSVGVCCVGAGNALRLDDGYMSTQMWASLLGLIRDVRKRFGVQAAAIKGHREFPSGKAQGKTCPGFEVGLIRALLRKEAGP